MLQSLVTPEQAHAALNMLDQNCSNMQGSRRDHETLQRSAATLKAFIVQHTVQKEVKKSEVVKDAPQDLRGGNA